MTANKKHVAPNSRWHWQVLRTVQPVLQGVACALSHAVCPCFCHRSSPLVTREEIHRPFHDVLLRTRSIHVPHAMQATHVEFRDRLRAFVDKEIIPYIAEWDEKATYATQRAPRFAELL